jgi:hypothetical protein
LIGCLILTAGLGNTFFWVFQLLKARAKKVWTAIFVDQLQFCYCTTLEFILNGIPMVFKLLKRFFFFHVCFFFLIVCVMNSEFWIFYRWSSKQQVVFVSFSLLSVGLQLFSKKKKKSVNTGTFGIRSFI